MKIGPVLRYSKAHNGRAIVIKRNGATVVEAYHNGFVKGSAWWLRSGCKSFCGVVAAKMVDDGHIASFDVKVSSVITEWQSDPLKEPATLRELLSLQSGVSTIGGLNSQTYEEAIAMPAVPGKRGTFEYGSSPFWTFGEFVNRATPANFLSTAHYLRDEICRPLAIPDDELVWAYLKPSPDFTQPNLAGGAGMTITAWAKFGEFMRKRGRGPGWQQIVSSDVLAEITQPSAGYTAYGMTWWRTKDDIGVAIAGNATANLDSGGYAAIGAQMQLLYVFPDIHTTVARFGDMDTAFNEAEFVGLIRAM